MHNSEEDEQWVCPSFNTYSSNTFLADIVKDNDHDGDFEFSRVCYDDLVASGEEAICFFEGQSQRPIFPLFNRDLLNNLGEIEVDDIVTASLEKLFIEELVEKEVPSSSTSEIGAS
ncbi:hypothetical protein Leryth_013216 [Lithospermum erythrorhizon]|nr:hypothetical protein Leryth_013216 [Lithospermum erythrorhizon]